MQKDRVLILLGPPFTFSLSFDGSPFSTRQGKGKEKQGEARSWSRQGPRMDASWRKVQGPRSKGQGFRSRANVGWMDAEGEMGKKREKKKR